MTARARWRPLAVLTVAVLALHAVLLQPADVSVRMPNATAARPMLTRTIVLPPPVTTREELVEAIAKPPPRPVLRNRTASVAGVPLPLALSPEVRGSAASPPAPVMAAPRVAVSIPASTRLAYKVVVFTKGQTQEGKGELLWRREGSEYEARLEVTAPFMPTRLQQSSGEITAEGLAPRRFADRYRGEQATHFERDKGQVIFSSNTPPVDLMPGAQDRLSVMMQVAALVAGDPAKYREGTSITLQTATTREAPQWVFAVEGDDELQLPAGRVTALKLTRNPRREYDQRVELWLAPGMAYVPVRLRLTNSNGDWVDQQWSGTDRP